jgi:hypothetical protein
MNRAAVACSHDGIEQRPRLTVVSSEYADSLPVDTWDGDGARLWSAWQSLQDWEERVDGQFNPRLGEKLLVLWAISRLTGAGDGSALLHELIDEDLRPRFTDPLLEDMVYAAFALGAAWHAASECGHDRRDDEPRNWIHAHI